ncbi:transcriptional regulator, AraC family with amidase-like domain [Ruegeria faecimaris]|uniref:Transcriptional regulator, AraC family with amidase-like domain n=2 Tax=Ruegeria faecimaris TaxID=686389 RepID=A0A521CRA9_9RHOB|nr:transcriptional regulator, AraC family with amidase-like domain [Ruegeria faecimaris]
MDNPRFLPKGAISVDVSYDGPPKAFYFLLLPNTTMLAFSAAIEPLRISNQLSRKQLFEWYVLSTDGEPVTCSNGIRVQADHSVHDLEKGAFVFVCSGTQPMRSFNTNVLNWIRRQKAHGCEFGGICTGAFALAKAGVIGTRNFTVHWENRPGFCENFPTMEPTQNLYEIDGKLRTCGGGHASTDMMLEVIEELFGNALANNVSEMCLHRRLGEGGSKQVSPVSALLGTRNAKLIEAVQIMRENIETQLSLEAIADQASLSRRHMERLFRQHTNMSPGRFYNELRLDRAFALLNETNLSVSEIAFASGFSSTDRLSVHFRNRFRISPHNFRRSWSEETHPE